MAVREKSGNEILLEQLTKRVLQLAQEEKSKQASIKELDAMLFLKETSFDKSIDKLREDYEKRREALSVEIAPLERMRGTCLELKREIDSLKQKNLNADSDLKSAHGLLVASLLKSEASLQKRVAAIQATIEECKRKVAAV